MSNSSWSEQLVQSLTTLAKTNSVKEAVESARIAILGIGNELNGDDAAGVEVVRRLQFRLTNRNVLILDGGIAPENITGPIRRFDPKLVILVDCADIGRTPGSIAWLEMDDLGGFSASTHILPPTVLAHYLSSEIGCQVSLIGIQPESLEFGAGLSPEIENAVGDVVDQIVSIF